MQIPGLAGFEDTGVYSVCYFQLSFSVSLLGSLLSLQTKGESYPRLYPDITCAFWTYCLSVLASL